MYDVERFGIINTGNPKHADIFLITGSINEQNISVVKQIYEQMPEPKVVAAIGICATSGGVFKDCYNIMGGVDTVIPVDVYVPGCAARPEAIIDGVVKALGALDEKKKVREKHSHEAAAAIGDVADPDAFDLPDGAPPEPPEEPILPGDDVEVKYFGAAPDDEDVKAEKAEVVSSNEKAEKAEVVSSDEKAAAPDDDNASGKDKEGNDE
jgi:ech hydrogenase subunit C